MKTTKKKLFIVIFLLSRIFSYTSFADICSNPSPIIEDYIRNAKNILFALKVEERIQLTEKQQELANWLMDKIAMDIRNILTPAMGIAWWTAQVIFKHIIVGWGSTFLDNFYILFRPFPIVRDWLKLIPLKEQISHKLIDMWYAWMLDKKLVPDIANYYKQKFSEFPVILESPRTYSDMIDALWINQIIFEKAFLEATQPDKSTWKAKLKDFAQTLLNRKNKNWILKLNQNAFNSLEWLNAYYKPAKQCDDNWKRFMKALKDIKKIFDSDYQKITERFVINYERLKDALNLWNWNSDLQEREKVLIAQYMWYKWVIALENYYLAKQNKSLIDVLKDRVSAEWNWMKQLNDFFDETSNVWEKLKSNIWWLLSNRYFSRSDLQWFYSSDCDAIQDRLLKDLCEKNKEKWITPLQDPNKVLLMTNITSGIQAFNTAFSKEYKAAKLTYAEWAHIAVNGVTKVFPSISKKIWTIIQLIIEEDMIYQNLVKICKNQCVMNFDGKCEAE